ncbi:hypothetical protein D3C72_1827830 [compost metagenome]
MASAGFMLPEICTRPPPISLRITGAVTTSLLFFSTSTIAMRLPMFSAVRLRKISAPVLSRPMSTEAPPFWSKPGWAELMLSPVSSTSFFSRIFWMPCELASSSSS